MNSTAAVSPEMRANARSTPVTMAGRAARQVTARIQLGARRAERRGPLAKQLRHRSKHVRGECAPRPGYR